MRASPLRRVLAPTRRSVLAGAAALTTVSATPAATDDLQRVCDGDGDPRHALAGLAGAAAEGARGRAWRVAYGRAHIDPDRPMTPRSPARVASVSKLVTAVAVMRLVEQGRLGLDDDASDRIGFRLRHPRFPQAAITVRSLLSHTSGVRNGPSFPVPFGRPLSAAFTPGGVQFDDGGWWSPPDEPPGWFAYSDANFACLAQIVERATGERFDRHMTATVLRPLGLDAGFNWSGVDQAARDRAAGLYRKGTDEAHFDPDGPWRPQLDQSPPPAPVVPVVRAPDAADRPLDTYRPGENGFVFAPQGGLRASASDLLVIARLLVAGGDLGDVRLLQAGTVALMRTPVWRWNPARPNGTLYGGGAIRAYGLGTCVLTGARGADGDALFPGCAGWFGHLGEAYGLKSGLWVDPRSGRAFSYVVNGVASPDDQNRGRRSAFTWQEERIAAALASG